MLIGIISDTHGHKERISQAVEIFNNRNVDLVFHCGDIGSSDTAEAFKNIQSNMYLVYGNCDFDKNGLQRAFKDFASIMGTVYTFNMDDKKIFMTHKNDDIYEDIKSQNYDYVFYGHTHEQDLRKVGRTLVVNPGAVYQANGNKGSIAILNTDDDNVEFISV